MEVKMNMPDPPEGYEYTGEFRQAHAGEPRLDNDGKVCKIDHQTKGIYAILRKKKVTRPPVPGDIKDAPIPCRVSHDGFGWFDAYLVAVMPWTGYPYGACETHPQATTAPRTFATYQYCTIEVDE